MQCQKLDSLNKYIEMKTNWKNLQYACRFRETPIENELYGLKKRDRCFYNTGNWSEATICGFKHCPLN